MWSCSATWPETWPSTLAMFGSGSSSNGPRSLTVRGHVAGHVSGHVRRSAVTFWPRFGHVQRGRNMAHNMAERSGHVATWPMSSLSRSCSGHVRGHVPATFVAIPGHVRGHVQT